MPDDTPLPSGSRGLGDMDPKAFRAAAHRVADIVADYLEKLESFPVLPDIEPGEVRAALPPSPPDRPEPLDSILADYLRLIEPNITHWQHPGFMAYFSSVATGPGILGEWLATGLNSNVMLWRNAPASTELEELVVAWIREMLGLPKAFDGMLTDTASVSTLLSVSAARHAVPGLNARDEGLAGREGLGRLRMYTSTESHFSVDKAAVVTGVGRNGVRHIVADASYRMIPEELARAIEQDRAAGDVPFCVVATAGTTSSSSVDPIDAIADVCARERLWLHVDAAYGGAAALAPEMRGIFKGWERADSIVVNPHKWMFTPFDASLLFFRDPELLRDAFRIVPEYLRTRESDLVHNFNEYGFQLGRRFRALKLWMLIRSLGVTGMADRIREHCRLAQTLAGWVDADPDWQRLADVPFGLVCLRYRPRSHAGTEGDASTEAWLDARNELILDHVNRSGRIFLSHTRLHGRYAIRVALGNPRATEEHVRRCWDLLREGAASTKECEGPS